MKGNLQKRGVNSWRLKYDCAADGSGRRQTRYVTIKGTKAEAQAQAIKHLAAVADGLDVDPSKLTVAGHLRAWLDGPHGLAAKTHERYRDLTEHQVIPHLGALPLQKLRPAHIADWHAVLLRSGGQGGRPLSARTVSHAHRVLHRGLEIALSRELVSRNAAHAIKPPKVEEVEIEALRADEIAPVLEALKGHWLEPIAILALSAGPRRGELLGLSWGSVDLQRGSMTISRSLEQTRAGLSFKRPKTKSGVRHVSLPPIAIEALKEHRLRQLERRVLLGLGKPGNDALVFTTPDGQPMPPNNLSRDWARFLKARNLPSISFHSLRHSHVSMLIAGKLDPLTVARRVSHANPATTMRVYAHMWKQTDDAAADAAEAALRTGKER
jgi:integrase